jgi:hypothetical protein
MERAQPLFRGSELPRLLLLLAILVGGSVFVWQFAYSKQVGPAPEPVLRAGDALVPIEPDQSAEFEGVTDKTRIGLRDTAAYLKLLERARKTNEIDLAKQSRRDVLFVHLWEHPKEHRGVPVHILGTAARIVRERSKHSKSGWLYTATVYTPEAGKFPYWCVFEDAPPMLPIGDNLSERIVFNGYFLKLVAYRAHDTERANPMLIGRIGWTPGPPDRADAHQLLRWTLIALGAMFVTSVCRWMYSFRRTIQARRKPLSLRDRPNDVISAEELAHYFANADDEAKLAPSRSEPPAPTEVAPPLSPPPGETGPGASDRTT